MTVQNQLVIDVRCYCPGRRTCFGDLFNEGVVLNFVYVRAEVYDNT
jgi:hypothetical protein